MNRGIYPILSGALAQERQMQVFSNNVANVNTAGFKQDESLFRSLMSRSMGNAVPVSSTERVFVSAQGLKTVLESGRLRKTGNPYDMAIRGPGFFEVKTAQGTRYTRNGEFHVDGQRRLVTEMGDPVMGQRGEIKLMKGDVHVSPGGAIQVNGQQTDKIKVVEFLDNMPPHKSENGLFAGDKPKLSKDVVIETGYVEESNVNALTEMVKMIQSMRMYESAQKLIQAFDHMTELAVQDVGKLG
ncbi:MAG TPA: flagellar basal-body rod protein FlgF [Nitrospiraceae bacterium]|nr:flagellar basal-body rod protein FlgF [Nitrospiraceae bacterium]